MSYDVYTALLKMNDNFLESSDNVHLSYDLNDPKLQEIKQKYGLDDIAGKGNDFYKAINMLFWVSENCYHNGNYNFEKSYNAINLLEYSFQKGKDFGINCVALSTILTECLMSLGLFARTVFIMPFSPNDEDNHVVTHVYINELKKWIMLDPTYKCYVIDKNKTSLNILEIRELLANQENIEFNKEIKYNDDKREYDSNENIEYLAKNLYYFMTYEKSCFNSEKDNRIIHIIPSVFDIKKREILNIEYRIKKQGEKEWLKNWLENQKNNNYLFSQPSELIKNPKNK